MKNEEKHYEVVGDIRIKEPKKKKNKKKKTSTSNTPLGIKILVWFMFLAMFASFIVPLVSYFVSVISAD